MSTLRGALQTAFVGFYTLILTKIKQDINMSINK